MYLLFQLWHYAMATLALLLCTSIQINAANISWSTLTNGTGNAPNPQSVIVVQAGDRLTFDAAVGTNEIQVKGILIFGEFVVADANVLRKLKVDWILVSGGIFQVGTENSPFKGKFCLTLSGDENEQFSLQVAKNKGDNYYTTSSGGPSNQMLTDLEQVIGDENYSFLMAMGSGAEIHMHTDDAEDKKSWALLDRTMGPGNFANSVRLDQQTSWEVGDRIVIASSDFDLNQAEEFTITNVQQGGRVVTIDGNVAYDHYGDTETYTAQGMSWDLDMRAEVALLSRDVKIQGDVNYNHNEMLADQTDQFGGHIMIMNEAAMYMSGVEFRYMGQAEKLGRYCVHWHKRRDVNGQYLKHCASSYSFNKGYTIHSTHNALLEENTVFESIGHSYYLEDGAEVGNRLIRNLAINARTPKSEAVATVNSDFDKVSGFWIENARNTFIENRVGGSEKNGFYYQCEGLNGTSTDASWQDLEYYGGPVEGQNVGNVAHSLKDGRGIVMHNQGYAWNDRDSRLFTDENPQRLDPNWVMHDFTVYKVDLGIYVRGLGGIISDVKMADVLDGTRLRLMTEIRNSLIVGRTNNVGITDMENEQRTGHQLYDGPGGLNGVHFVNFNNSDRAIRNSNAAQKSLVHFVNRLSFENTPQINRFKVGGSQIELKGVIDIDGSLCGIPGAQLVERFNNAGGNPQAYLRTNLSIENSDWNVFINPQAKTGNMWLRNLDDNSTSFVVTRSDGEQIDRETNGTQFPFIYGDHFTYKMDFQTTTDNLEFYMHDVPYSDEKGYVIFELTGLGAGAAFELNTNLVQAGDISKVIEATSMELLQAAHRTAIYRDFDNNSVFIKFIAQMKHGWNWPQPFMTHQNKLMGGVQVLVSNIGSNSDPGCELCPCGQSNTPNNCSRSDDKEENKNTWVGESNIGWFDHPCNWSKGHFPTECNTVVIPSDKIVYIEPGQLAKCYDIFIGSTGFLNIMDGAELQSDVD